MFRLLQIFQAMLAQIAQSDIWRKPVASQGLGRYRDQDLASVSGRHDAGGAVHIQSHVIIAAKGGLAGMKTHPNRKPDPFWPLMLGERFLSPRRRRDPVRRSRERDEKRVA